MKKYTAVLALAFTVMAVQVAVTTTGTGFYLTQLTMTAYYSLVVVGLCLLMGYAGQISIGHAGFFAIGGYLSALFTTYDLTPFRDAPAVRTLDALKMLMEREDLYGGAVLHLKPWPACIIAVGAAIVIAWLIAGPVLRLKGHYLAMATLGFGVIVYRVVLGTSIFGEADGISEVPAFVLLPGLAVSGSLSARVSNYYIAWGLVVFTMWCLLNLVDSRIGSALKSIHGAEDAARAVGVDTARFKLKTFVLSAALAAVAGVLLTHYNGGIGPSEASVIKSVRYVALVAVGGMANLWGALVMSAVLNFLSLRGYFGSMDDAVFGTILILIMLFAPEGLIGKHVVDRVRAAVSGKGRGSSHASS